MFYDINHTHTVSKIVFILAFKMTFLYARAKNTDFYPKLLDINEN
jgi:hypothetical protein